MGHRVLRLAHGVFDRMEDRCPPSTAVAWPVADARRPMVQPCRRRLDRSPAPGSHRPPPGDAMVPKRTWCRRCHRGSRISRRRPERHRTFARDSMSSRAGRLAAAMGENLPAGPSPRPGCETVLARLATTIHWSRTFFSSGRLLYEGAAVPPLFYRTLSAPQVRSLRISSVVRTPPPSFAAAEAGFGGFRCTTSKSVAFS